MSQLNIDDILSNFQVFIENQTNIPTLHALHPIHKLNLINDYVYYYHLLTFLRQENITKSQRGEVHEQAAAALTLLFKTRDEAHSYLTKRAKGATKLPIIKELGALNFQRVKFDIALWQQLASKHLPSSIFIKALAIAADIEDFVKSNEAILKEEINSRIRTQVQATIERDYIEAKRICQDSLATYCHRQFDRFDAVIKKEIRQVFHQLSIENVRLAEQASLSNEQRQLIIDYKKSPKGKALLTAQQTQISASYQKRFDDEYQQLKAITELSCADFVNIELLKRASIIKTFCHNAHRSILAPHTTLDTLRDYVARLTFKKYALNPEVANLFLQNNLNAHDFNTYLNCHPSDDDIAIPAVTIDGAQFNYDNFYIHKLPSTDPIAAYSGNILGNCLKLGDYGEKAVLFGISDPRAGFYILRSKANNVIVAVTLAWRDDENGLVFDSVESDDSYASDTKRTKIVIAAYTYLAHHLVTHYDISRVTVGKDGGTSEHFGILLASQPGRSKRFHDSDSNHQLILADRAIPLYAEMNFIRNGIDKPNNQSTLLATKKDVFEWLENCIYTNLDDFLHDISPIALQIGLSEIEINRHIANLRTFHEFQSPYLHYRNWDIIQVLISDGINVNFTGRRYTPIILLAAKDNRWDIVKLCIEKEAKVDINIRYEYTPIFLAINENMIGIVKLMLERGANPDNNLEPNMPGIYTATHNNNLEMIKLLRQFGADLNQPNSRNVSPLNLAIMNGYNEIALYLLAQGASPFFTNHHNHSAAHTAVSFNNEFILRELLRRGINVEYRGNTDTAPFDLARPGSACWTILRDHLKSKYEVKTKLFVVEKKRAVLPKPASSVNNSYPFREGFWKPRNTVSPVHSLRVDMRFFRASGKESIITVIKRGMKLI